MSAEEYPDFVKTTGYGVDPLGLCGINCYQATQRMRQLETLMRKERLDVHLLKKAGAENEQVKEARARYRKTSAEYREFTEAMGMKEQIERVTVDGLGRV